MSQTIISPTAILNEAGRLFHEKAKFIGSINTQYDNRFAQSGAKVGNSILLRDRNAFTVTTGATLTVQQVTETYQTLTVGTQKHVGMDFTSADLTMKMDAFTERYVDPAVAILVASVEADVLEGCRKQVGNFVDHDATAFNYIDVANAKRMLDETLTPDDGRRSLLLCPTHAVKYLDASKGFYNPASALGQQYASGIVKDFTGFNIQASAHLTSHLTGTALGGDTSYNVDGATEEGSSVTLDSGASTTFLAGDIVTFAGCYAVHPESKAAFSYLKQFTVTENNAGGAGELKIRPAIVVTGPKQNVSAYPTNGGAVSKLGSGTSASQYTVESLAYHKDAFIFATADLQDMSQFGGWGARKEMDGISMRLWRQGDIFNDSAPCRLDVYYGYLARYPEMACRIHADG